MEYQSGNIFLREMSFAKAGDVVEGHTHNFDHTTYIARGSVKIEKLDADGNPIQTVVKRAVDGHNWVLILKDVCHRLTALEDNSMGHCIYSHRNPQGEVVQIYEGWDKGTI
jgi:quercetin dioxygenase-like cupin family protein